MTTSAGNPTHEDRLRALEERLLEIAEAIHRLREDMSAPPPEETEE
ncbi:hypothetical protein [Pseudomonas sp. HMSC75E02]|nr:hypothetical protein [Pseudomonas sp. HMSC75E02]